jgi:hypothetical protein
VNLKTFFTKSLLTLPLLGLVPGSADAQIYTDEQINSDVCLLPYEWNMRDNEYSFGQYCGPFPAGFNRFNVIETGAFIHSDLNPTTGRANSASTLYRLHTVDQSPKRYLGGEYTVQIIGNVDAPYSIYGSFNMRRGSENYDHNYFEDVAFSANRRRAFGRVDYLNMGVAPVTKTTTDYYFPIGHWDMSTSASQPLKVKSISLPNMDINKIVGVSTIIYSNSVGGKIKADQFDRRGSTQTSINGETRGFYPGRNCKRDFHRRRNEQSNRLVVTAYPVLRRQD